ncbi:MAG: xanthine dehydrogenase family protein molybdopterin-binding subunit [Spirochaetota bacterium]
MKSIGNPINRVGGSDRTTGKQQFVGDIKLPYMLHMKPVSIPCAHAEIESIDISKALEVEGVVAAFRGEDLPQPIKRYGPAYKDRPLLADKTVNYHGEPVAVVIGETPHAAAVGATLVEVSYTEITPILTVEQALDPDAELVQKPELRGDHPYKHTNILDHWDFGWGEVDTCEADTVVENTYYFSPLTHFAIEPYTYLATPTNEGITVYSAMQNPFRLQQSIADALEMPLSKVTVISPDPGGAFGGKQHPKFEHICAYAALQLGKPVRVELSLEESFQAARRTSARIDIRTGFNKDGTLAFQDIATWYLAGAYADIAPRIASKGSYLAAGPYRVPHVRIDANVLLSHTVPSTAFRGFGNPQANWAYESQMDAGADALGIDRVEIRRINLPERRQEFIPGDQEADGIWSQTLLAGAKEIGWDTPLKPGRGRGISLGIKMGATSGASYAIARLHSDGSVTIFSGTSDMGQGARTIFTQIVSEELGVPVERITMVMGDTSKVPYDLQTSASRSTVFMGSAILNACTDIKKKLRGFAAEVYQESETDIQVEPGLVVTASGKQATYTELMTARFGKLRGEVIGVGEKRSELIKGMPLGGKASFYEFVCCAAEVEVNKDTGEITIDKLVIVGDVGKALNSQHAAMQDEGAAAMALGHTLMEQYIYDEHGRIKNLGALDYRIPTIKDVPRQLISKHVENGDGPGPYGAKGISEGGTLCVSPAIAAAVENAIGVRIRSLPLTPEKVWKAMNTR